MSWRLVVQVLDHAPADLTAAEVAVLVAVAEWARDTTRETTQRAAELQRRTRLSETGLRAALRRLAARGLEVRVPLRDDKHGRPVFAVPGTVTRYRLPPFPPPAGCGCPVCQEGVTPVTPHSPEDAVQGVTGAPARGHASGPEGSPGRRPLRPVPGRRARASAAAPPSRPTGPPSDPGPAPAPADPSTRAAVMAEVGQLLARRPRARAT